MFPTLQDLFGWGPPIDTHSAFVALGMMAAGVVFLIEKRRRGVTDPRIPYLVLGALAGAAVASRLGTWAQHLDPTKNLSLGEQLAFGNASMLSALVGAWLGVHVAKRIVRYPLRTGDLFAPAVALAMAIGRFGCFFTERPGTPTGADWGIVLDAETAARVGSPAGVPLHPSFLYEIAFHAAAFAVHLVLAAAPARSRPARSSRSTSPPTGCSASSWSSSAATTSPGWASPGRSSS